MGKGGKRHKHNPSKGIVGQAFNPKPQKQAKGQPKPLSSQIVTFNFKLFDYHWQWGSDNSQKCCISSVFDDLKNREGKKWSEINRGRDHTQPIHTLEEQAKKRLSSLHLTEYENMYRLRLSSGVRLWGIKDGEEFLVIWWDPEHQVYLTDKSTKCACGPRNISK